MHKGFEKGLIVKARKEGKQEDLYINLIKGSKQSGKPFIEALVAYIESTLKREENAEKELSEGNPNVERLIFYRQGYNKAINDILTILTKE